MQHNLSRKVIRTARKDKLGEKVIVHFGWRICMHTCERRIFAYIENNSKMTHSLLDFGCQNGQDGFIGILYRIYEKSTKLWILNNSTDCFMYFSFPLHPFCALRAHTKWIPGTWVFPDDFIISLISKIDIQIGNTRRVFVNKKVAGFKIKKDSNTILA